MGTEGKAPLSESPDQNLMQHPGGFVAVVAGLFTLGATWYAGEALGIINQGGEAVARALSEHHISDVTQLCLQLCAEAQNPQLCVLVIPTLSFLVGCVGMWAYVNRGSGGQS